MKLTDFVCVIIVISSVRIYLPFFRSMFRSCTPTTLKEIALCTLLSSVFRTHLPLSKSVTVNQVVGKTILVVNRKLLTEMTFPVHLPPRSHSSKIEGVLMSHELCDHDPTVRVGKTRP